MCECMCLCAFVCIMYSSMLCICGHADVYMLKCISMHRCMQKYVYVHLYVLCILVFCVYVNMHPCIHT